MVVNCPYSLGGPAPPPPPPPPPEPPSAQTPSGPIVLRTGQTYQNLAIDATGTVGIGGAGFSNTVVKNVSVKSGNYGMKIGSGAQSSFVVDGLVIDGSRTGIYLDDLHDSVLSNLNVYAPRDTSTNQTHALYVESNVVGVTIRDAVFKGGSGYTLHLYHTGAQSQRITFERCVIDARLGRYPMVISAGFDDVKLLGCTFIGGSSGQVIQFYGGSNILVDGFTASGCAALIAGSCTSAIVRNGTYQGPAIGSATGVTVTGVTRV